MAEKIKFTNCAVCDRRHALPTCPPVYAQNPDGSPRLCAQNTRKGVYGAVEFAKKRFHPHHNKRDLQLVQLTQDLFPSHSPYWSDPMEAMRYARTEACRILGQKAERQRKLKRRQRMAAMQVNAGLKPNGFRVAGKPEQFVSLETERKRQEKQKARTEANKNEKTS